MVPASHRREQSPEVMAMALAVPEPNEAWPATPSRTTPQVRWSVGGTRPTGSVFGQPPLSPVPLQDTSGFQSENAPFGFDW